MKTSHLIEALAQDSASDASLRWNLPRALKVALIAGNIAAGAIFFIWIGFRPDIMAAAETTRFLLKFVITIPIATAATAALLRVSRPGTDLGSSGWALAISPAILIVAVIVELNVLPERLWVMTLIGNNASHCLTMIPLLALGPLVCLLVALREGAPTRPGLAGAIAGLAASGIAATFYATNCSDDSPLYVATWYPLATGIVVLAGYLGGRAFLRW
ncbi:MAG: hypothetical protein JWP21_1705 [Tardiphaga sp.]|jgi:hypothetical protein|nr:hypothetical protein [Tardiphaga sp.]MDB5628568.1 hypothetical protein [Tardiphaga sp.]